MREIDLVLSDMQNVLTDRQLTILKNSMIEHFCRPTGTELAVVSEDDRLIKMFIASKTVGGRTTSSIRQYIRVVNELRSIVGKNLVDIQPTDIEYFLLTCRKNGGSTSYINSKRSYLSSFYTWLVSRGEIKANPLNNVEKAKIPERQKEVFTEEEIKQLIDNAHCLRDKAIIMTLLSTECRVGELCSINLSDIDFLNGRIRVYGVKGKRDRLVPLDGETARLIHEYVDSRDDDCDALFVGTTGRIAKSSVQSMLERLGKECNIHVHAHKFRRTRITESARRGMPLQDIAYVAGHKNMNTTYNSYIAMHGEAVVDKARQMFENDLEQKWRVKNDSN